MNARLVANNWMPAAVNLIFLITGVKELQKRKKQAWITKSKNKLTDGKLVTKQYAAHIFITYVPSALTFFRALASHCCLSGFSAAVIINQPRW